MANIHEVGGPRGFPGNQLMSEWATSSDTALLDYQVGFRRPVVAISSITYFVQSSQSGTFFTYGGQSCGVKITLPPPEPGLWYEFSATGAIATAATIITSVTSGAMVRAGNSGGADALTPEATTAEFTANGGVHLEVIGVSTTQYLVKQFQGGTSDGSTGRVYQFKDSS